MITTRRKRRKHDVIRYFNLGRLGVLRKLSRYGKLRRRCYQKLSVTRLNIRYRVYFNRIPDILERALSDIYMDIPRDQ